MILLLSASYDFNIDFVVEWLEHYQYPYLRINADQLLTQQVYLSIQTNELIIDTNKILLDEIKVVWLNKFAGFSHSSFYLDTKDSIKSNILNQLAYEFRTLTQTLISFLKDKKWLIPPHVWTVHKLDILRTAHSFQIKTPDSYIVSTKTDLYKLMELHTSLISKSIYEMEFFREEDGTYSMFTTLIDKKEIDTFPDENFYPSLVQKNIEKLYEIRSYYLDGAFYSVAIFSQNSQHTKVDSRKISFSQQSPRSVPYQLPKELEDKMDRMLKHIGLNSCSLDFIRSKEDKEYYFLEVNPTGQYSIVADSCGYDLNQKIAQKLIEMDKN
ncbi:grasp-with-spasm system ATP-grasp peptide maturase [Bernardetia sp. OM2101]|uniref:grasp-with-spasm system ATP-grasp peptide maturase n=1 Tax=Bernardetia sp. OM2101 TaxID=3344876 RepID=UPI0035CEF580